MHLRHGTLPNNLCAVVPAIATNRLCKRYGSVTALQACDLALHGGEGVLITGANGSGKSTFLRLAAGLEEASGGTITRQTSGGEAWQTKLGFVGHSAMVYPDLSGRENLAFFFALQGHDASEHADAPPSPWLSAMIAEGTFDRPARGYSKGQLQRLALARALMPGPEIVLLDEPATGLDPSAAEMLLDALQERIAAGGLVVVVSHNESHYEAIATRHLRFRAGRVEGADTADE